MTYRSLNKTKIEWCDSTLNAVVGCTNGCSYCYARIFAGRNLTGCPECRVFKPHAHLERLGTLSARQKPKVIFLDSMWDWNCPTNDPSWKKAILEAVKKCPQHVFVLLSKLPKSYDGSEYPKNMILGTTVTCEADMYRLGDLALMSDNPLLLNFEPLHGGIKTWFRGVDWVIVGAETGRRKEKIRPEPEWVESIINNAAAEQIPVFVKGNVKWPLNNCHQFPTIIEAMRQRARKRQFK